MHYYSPSFLDILIARKLLLQVVHEAKLVNDPKRMTDEEYQAQIEELNRIIALEKASKM